MAVIRRVGPRWPTRARPCLCRLMALLGQVWVIDGPGHGDRADEDTEGEDRAPPTPAGPERPRRVLSKEVPGPR
jgi:hypothetical protein